MHWSQLWNVKCSDEVRGRNARGKVISAVGETRLSGARTSTSVRKPWIPDRRKMCTGVRPSPTASSSWRTATLRTRRRTRPSSRRASTTSATSSTASRTRRSPAPPTLTRACAAAGSSAMSGFRYGFRLAYGAWPSARSSFRSLGYAPRGPPQSHLRRTDLPDPSIRDTRHCAGPAAWLSAQSTFQKREHAPSSEAR